jgi:hypothetical protein
LIPIASGWIASNRFQQHLNRFQSLPKAVNRYQALPKVTASLPVASSRFRKRLETIQPLLEVNLSLKVASGRDWIAPNRFHSFPEAVASLQIKNFN